MAGKRKTQKDSINRKNSVFGLLKPYRGKIALLVIFALLSNGMNLLIPQIISQGIDSYQAGEFNLQLILIEFIVASSVIFIFGYSQAIVQTITSEKVAFNLREQLSNKISRQGFTFIQKSDPSKLLTNLTSDMDSIKMFVGQAVANIASSVFIIIGASALLLMINWRLAVPVIGMIPIIALAFAYVFKKVNVLFRRSREVIDWLNKVINESILGSAIIRVLNSQHLEYKKFIEASNEAKNLGVSILNLFATLIPVITFVSNLAILSILILGGHLVITDSLTLGEFAAFNSYVAILIFPIMVIGFMSNIIAQSSASYERINRVMQAPETADKGTVDGSLTGEIEVNDVSLIYNDKPTLKNVSFSIKAGTRTAIIGPTAAGKSQLLYLLTGLIQPDKGTIKFDGIKLEDYLKKKFYQQVGFVFQDSVMFNMSLRENIAFNETVTEESLNKAVETSELKDFIKTLPKGMDTIVAERGTSLSGGQKQRVMLARALALNPKILLLDDFTARVDKQTEDRILRNVRENYPDITLISISQKIAPVSDFDQIILLMEGEIVATGKHKDLLKTCPEYIQIYNSQRSTSHYELRS